MNKFTRKEGSVKLATVVLIVLVLGSNLSGCAKTKVEEIELTVSAAASLTDAMNEIGKVYHEKNPNITLKFAFGASGALQTQIEEGAPSDLFVSAAQKQMKALDEKGLVDKDTIKQLLKNDVVFIVPKDSQLELKNIEDCATDKVKTIAVGDPASVPVGQYTEEIFKSLGITDKVKNKCNYASDVRQVLTWVESGEADCGIVYATDAATSDKVNIACSAPKGSHKEIIYPAAVLKGAKYGKEAKEFLDFLSGKESVDVFTKYGFKL